MYYPKEEYTFIKFIKSPVKGKKYKAILRNKKTKREVGINFGAIKPSGEPYPQYKDKALGLYKKYDHGDTKRRENYIKRHAKDINKAYSPSWFALKYLW